MSDATERKLAHLEAVKRARSLNIVGPAAAVMAEWMGWLWTTPGVFEAMKSPPKAETTAFTAPTNMRSSYETTYSRTTTPKRRLRVPLSRKNGPIAV
jgi:hypothetical protein